MSNKTVFLYALSAISLLMLAAWMPKLAISVAVLLNLGVVVVNADAYAGMLDALAKVTNGSGGK